MTTDEIEEAKKLQITFSFTKKKYGIQGWPVLIILAILIILGLKGAVW